MDPDERHEDWHEGPAAAEIARTVEAMNHVLPIITATHGAISNIFPDMETAEAAMNGEFVETWFHDLPENIRNGIVELSQANFRLHRTVSAVMNQLHEDIDALGGE